MRTFIGRSGMNRKKKILKTLKSPGSGSDESKDSLTQTKEKIMSNKNWSMIRNAALTFALAAGVSQATVSTCGGNVQIVNLLNASAQAGLDLTSVGSGIEIANFTVSNNTSQFTLAFSFANGGVFINTAHAAQTVPMTGVHLVPVNATYGTGVAPVVPATPAEGASIIVGGDLTARFVPAHATPTVVTWTPAAQSTPTTGLIFSMQADWAAATTVLAGLYTEQITATLTATL